MQHLEGSGTPVLYIGRTVLKAQCTCHGFVDVRIRVRETPLRVGFHFLEQKVISRC